jgi:hypothetical protein
MPVPLVHARGADFLNRLVGPFCGRKAVAAPLETAEFLVLVWRDE